MESELVVIEIDVPDTEPFIKVFHVLIKVCGRIISKAALKYAAVTVTAAIRTTTA
jgi:hypothetical protein